MLKSRIQTRKTIRKGWGGSHIDAATHAELFRDQGPTYFGVIDGQLFSTAVDGDMVNKRWVYLTEAQGNVYYTQSGENRYTWQLDGKIESDATITRVDAGLGLQPGKMNQEFYIYANKGWFHEPILLKTDSDEAPLLRIIGHPTQVAEMEWKYTVKLQDGMPETYIDPKWLQVGRRLIDASSSTGDELWEKFAGDYFANRFKLEGQIGYVGREMTFTDKAIRREMAGGTGFNYSSSLKGGGGSASFTDSHMFGMGYTYQVGLKDKTKAQKYERGTFVSLAEMRLGERLAEDKQNLCEWGRLETTKDWESGRQITVGAGWRQLRRESQYYTEHNGSLTLYELFSKIEDVYQNMSAVGPRKIVLSTGRGGIRWFSQMVNAEASANPFVIMDSYFIDKASTNISGNDLRFGAQFTEIRMTNGIILTVMYDPAKDNVRFNRELVSGTNLPYESYTFEIIDLADTDAAPKDAKYSRSNVAMVKEAGKAEYFHFGNVYNIHTGGIMNGGMASSKDKSCGIIREDSCGLAIWDIDRTLTFKYATA